MTRNIILVLILALSLSAAAQKKQKQRHDRDQWFNEMRQYKHDFLAKEIELTPEQRDRFFELYDQMSQRTRKMFDEARAQEKNIEKKGDAATDEEYLELARTMSDVKNREGAIELSYFEQFKQVLSPRQMVKLKKAERKFNNMMMRQHAKMSKNHSIKGAKNNNK